MTNDDENAQAETPKPIAKEFTITEYGSDAAAFAAAVQYAIGLQAQEGRKE